jgi:peptidoglycan/xylan/chitin deacetylase (PgdA/CDA1 family)
LAARLRRGFVASVRCSTIVAGLFGLSCHASSGTPAPPAANPTAGAATPTTAPVSVAITVDDLPVHGPLVPGSSRVLIADRLLEVFRQHHLPPVTGFVNGHYVVDEPGTEEVLRHWVAAGNPLGNHTYSHISLLKASLDEYFADLEKGEDVLRRLMPAGAGDGPWRVFRYPFLFEGDTAEKRNGVRRYLGEHGYKIAEVTVEADDWAFNPPFARCAERGDTATMGALHRELVAAHIEELGRMRELTRRLAGRDIPHILLLHIGEAEADTMDDLLTAFEKAGVRWIDLPTAIADPFYAEDPAVLARAGAAFPYLVARSRHLTTAPPTFARGLEQRLEKVCR